MRYLVWLFRRPSPLPFGPSSQRTTMPSADFSPLVKKHYYSFSQFPSHATVRGKGEISQGKIQNVPHVNAGFIKHTHSADGGLRRHVPARPGCTTPRIRFLFVAPCFRIGLPPDPVSRRRPCPSPSLRLRFYLARGLSPRSLCTMPGTHDLVTGARSQASATRRLGRYYPNS